MTSGRDEMFDGLSKSWRAEELNRLRQQMQAVRPGITPMGQVDQLTRGGYSPEEHMRSFATAMEQKFEAHRQQTQQVIERIATEVNDLRSMYDYIYRNYPDVIKEYDVIQRTKERLNVKG